VRPYPTAGEREETNTVRGKGKILIHTDTTVKDRLVEEIRQTGNKKIKKPMQRSKVAHTGDSDTHNDEEELPMMNDYYLNDYEETFRESDILRTLLKSPQRKMLKMAIFSLRRTVPKGLFLILLRRTSWRSHILFERQQRPKLLYLSSLKRIIVMKLTPWLSL